MKAEVLRDELAHVDACGLGAEYADLEILSVHQAHRRRSQRDHDGTFVFGLSMGDSELAPRLVDGRVEKSQFEVGLNGDVFSESVRVAGRRLDQHILTIKPQAFVCDLCSRDFKRTQALDGIYEELLCSRLCQPVAEDGVDKAADERMRVARWELTRCIFMTMAAMDQQEHFLLMSIVRVVRQEDMHL
jgi:hypothetical protein